MGHISWSTFIVDLKFTRVVSVFDQLLMSTDVCLPQSFLYLLKLFKPMDVREILLSSGV